MYELYNTIILAIFVWASPLYKYFVKKKIISTEVFMVAPIAYFVFYLTATNMPISEESGIYEGFERRLILYFLVMHCIVYALVTACEMWKKAKQANNENE